MGTHPWSSRLARGLVVLATPLVPRAQREEWRAEWEGELAAVSGDDESRRPRGRRSPLMYAMGAPADAAWMRQRAIADLTLVDDLRHGWRQLWQQVGFGLTAVGILALGMAASVSAFGVVSQLLLRPLPYPDPDRIVTLWERRDSAPGPADVAPGNFLDWRDRATSVRPLAGAEPYSYDYTGGDRPEVLRAVHVTEGFFEVFGIPPVMGRYFRPEEHKKGANHVVVVSARLWRSHFGADPNLIGRSIPLDDVPYTVVGIVPDEFQPHLLEDLPGQTVIWTAKAIEDHEPNIRVGGYWQVVGRLAEGQTLEGAHAELDAIARRIETERPRTNTESRIQVLTLREHLVGDVRAAVTLLAWAVGAVLLIACVNVTNLLLARGAVRQHELSIRTALGASRRRLVAQLLAESLLLSTISGLVGLLLAMGAVRLIATVGPPNVLWLDTLHVDERAFAFAMALACVVALAAGAVPALRLSGLGLQASGQRTMTTDRSHRRIRSALVAVEVALALVLVSGCGLLLRSFVNLLEVDTGFQGRGVAALQVFAWDRNPDAEARRAFFERVLDRLSTLPGVEAVGAVTAMPFVESNIDIQGVFRIAGEPTPARGEEPRASFNVATPGYFDVMRIPLILGRQLESRDGPKAPPVAVVSAALAARYWADANPVGDRVALRYNGRSLELEVVGVVGSTRHEGLDEPPRLEIFMPHAQMPSGSMTLVARTALEPQLLIGPAKAAVWEVDPQQTFYRTATLDELVGRTLATRRFALIVLTGFAALALLLAAAGLYGVLSSIATQYRREIGVRMALGAGWRDIVRLVVVRGLMVVAAGVAVGLIAVIGGARLLQSFLFSVAPTDPLSIGGAAGLMLIVAGIACYLPARRAAGADPVEVLRLE